MADDGKKKKNHIIPLQLARDEGPGECFREGGHL